MNLQQWVKEAKNGSGAAQKCLYDAFSGSMLLVCRRYIKEDRDAEELMLNGFYKFFTSLSSFQYVGDPALYAWIKKITVNSVSCFSAKRPGLL